MGRERGGKKAESNQRKTNSATTEIEGRQFLPVFVCPARKDNPPNCVLPFRMGYTYNGATSVMSSRTKYHGGGGGDLKTTNPSKQFDKNAYV